MRNICVTIVARQLSTLGGKGNIGRRWGRDEREVENGGRRSGEGERG